MKSAKNFSTNKTTNKRALTLSFVRSFPSRMAADGCGWLMKNTGLASPNAAQAGAGKAMAAL